MKHALKSIWVPATLAATVTYTLIGDFQEFNVEAFFASLLICTLHCYISHSITLKYFILNHPDPKPYWSAVSIMYIPIIFSFGCIYFYESADNFDFTAMAFPIFGLLIGVIVFTALIIRKIKFDLDIALALIFIMAAVGIVTAGIIAWITSLLLP
jgi:hypothetical protein